MSWSLDARDLDLLAIQADERLLAAVGARRRIEAADPAIALLAALAREVDAKPIPTDRLAGLRLVGQPTGAGRRARPRAALTGVVAAAAAVLSVGGVAAAVGGTPVSSVIRDTVGSVFNGDPGPSTAELVRAKLGDASAAWARGDSQHARDILEDINTQLERSDPGELPASLVLQVKRFEWRVYADGSPPPAPTLPPSLPPIAPAGTIGGDASQPADTEATSGDGDDDGTGQGQDEENPDDETTPTSEPTPAPTPSDPPAESPTPSAEPTPAPSTDPAANNAQSQVTDQDSSGLPAELVDEVGAAEALPAGGG